MSEPTGRRVFLRNSAIGAAGVAIAIAPRSEGQASPEGAIKVGVITHAGGAHLGAYFDGLAKTEEVASVVLADPDGNAEAMAREALGEKLTTVYADRDELLAKEQPGMALISMEAKLAPAAINAAMEAGCHVFAEKPACTNAEDFARLTATANDKGLHLMLALANRLNPEVQEAKRVIAEGELGDIYSVDLMLIEDQTRLTSTGYHESWFADKSRAGGGHLTWLGIHWLDLAMYITGSSVERVTGFTGNVGGQPINIEDSVAMAMQFENGTFGTLTSGYYLDKGYESSLKIWGSKGRLTITSEALRAMKLYRNDEGPSEYAGPSDFEVYTTFVRAAVRTSAGLELPPITADESLRVIRTVYGLYDAAESGCAVRVR